jgi:hypothetical protein
MGADTASKPEALRRGDPEAERLRSARLSAVGELIRLYEHLERALARTGDGEIAELVARSRHGERELATWARKLEELRGVKRRIESEPVLVVPAPAPEPARMGVGAAAMPFVWEALAFVIGFAISLVLT